MHKGIFAAAILGIALGPLPATAQGLPLAPDAAGRDEKKICRSEKMTGSLTRVRRVCLTAKEWDDLRLRTKHSFEDNVRGASGGCQAPDRPNGMCG